MIVQPLESALRPVEACAAFLDAPYPLLLDSAGGLPELSRYSYLTADPFLVLQADAQGLRLIHGDESQSLVHNQGTTFDLTDAPPDRSRRTLGYPRAGVDRSRRSRPPDETALVGDPFHALRDLLSRYQLLAHEGLPPFQGGAAGYWAYELGRSLERLPGGAVEDLPLPRLCIGLYDWVLAQDHQLQRSWLIATGLPSGDNTAARRRLAWVQARLAAHTTTRTADVAPRRAATIGSTFSRPAYEAAVARIKDYIVAGDVYQVNLSQRLQVPLLSGPWSLYKRLRQASPAPFGAFLGLPDRAAILSASPELFLRLEGRRVETRPIKGTRPRGRTPDEDEALRAELQASEKDRAENLMIVDLLRNDLGRVCQPGSIEVPKLFTLEAHPTVWQQVSYVTGMVEGDAGALDVLRACFPGGSVTGAPKIRAMEIIDEIEPVARGVYCGAIGYVAFNGAMETSIPIRTIVTTPDTAYVNVGGGIVADSVPSDEYDETLHKAAGALRALGVQE